MPNLLWPHGLGFNRLLCPWDSPGKNSGVGSHSLLQGIFPTQGSNPSLLHCRQIFYHLGYCAICLVWLFVTPWTVAHQAPLSMRILQARILEWAAMPSFNRSSQTRDWTQVSCSVGILYLLSHQGNLGILEWVAYPFSRGSFWLRNWTGVSCIAGEFFTSWATREAYMSH